jgi:hypothetical protein
MRVSEIRVKRIRVNQGLGVLEWSLSNLTFKKIIFPHESNKLCYVSIIRVIATEYAMKFPSTLLAYYFCLSLLWDWL